MSTEPEQSFANHARMVPGFHYVTFGLAFVYLLASIWGAVSARTAGAVVQLAGAVALMGVAWYARAFPLKAQDRVIRLEEQLRLTRLLPDDLRARTEELSPKQLIAMRFASDAELPELARWVITERITDSKAIKARIRDWRPDYHRV